MGSCDIFYTDWAGPAVPLQAEGGEMGPVQVQLPEPSTRQHLHKYGHSSTAPYSTLQLPLVPSNSIKLTLAHCSSFYLLTAPSISLQHILSR